MEDFATRIATLTEEKRTLLERTLKQNNLVLSAQQLIPRRGNHGPVPLSFAQQRLWFLSNLEPSSTAYNQAKAIRLSGDLNIDALNRALNALVRRHEILRTTVHSPNGVLPIQMVGEPRPLDFQFLDLSALSNEEKPSELENRLAEITSCPFDLTRDLMLRAALLKLSSDDHVLVLVTHHIATDGWSSGILGRELARLYRAFLKGEASSLPELPIQYADFAVWQRNWLQGEVLQNHIAYWKKQLDGITTLRLPTDRPRPAVQSYRGASQSLLLPKALGHQLQLLSRQEGVTLFMTLLAAFQTLLYRYCGQDDIAVGSPAAGRARFETEGLIGFFVNTLVLRSDLSGNPSFRQLLARVRKTALAAYEHQDLPFEKLVEELHPERDLGRSPLFQVMFGHQNQPWQPLEFSGIVMSPLEIKNVTAKFDLSLDTWEEPDGLKAILEYRTDLFDSKTVLRILSHFQTILEGIVADPNQNILDLPILTAAERHRLLVDWNVITKDYCVDKCTHQLIEEQVAKTPDALAVVCKDEQLTYRELNHRANQLAHHLRKLGIGPDDAVGLCLEHSANLIVGLLAIFKAGGAFVPLDPDHPKNRLEYTLEDTRATVLLTQERLKDLLPKYTGKKLALDSDWSEVAAESEENPHAQVSANNLAYVIFTSGSTGKPKGVMIEHGGLTNYLNHCVTAYPIHAGRGSLVHSSIAFDATITGLFAPLLVGRAVYLLPKSDDFEALANTLRQLRDFSLVKITPAHLALLGQQIPADEAKDLTHCFVIGGENLVADQISFWQNNAPAMRLFNEYGPTENVVGCIVYEASNWHGSGSVPIGRAIPNTTAYVLDQNMQPVPIGVLGEIYLGGAGVARGYSNSAELTQERFIADPFSAKPGAKLYRTGDLARYLSEGELEFVGRVDHQVKLRGFRIEFGEIEAVLVQHPMVREAVVMTRENVAGEKRLIAYVVSLKEMAPTASELRSFLQERLPDYMIPAAIVTMKALPLTPNGKVDRTALPAPDQTIGNPEKGFVAPRDALEQQLTKIWEKLLEVKPIGIRDNFFQLGGHSLLAISMTAQIEKRLGMLLPLAALFQAPTVEELADFLRHNGRSNYWSSLLAIQPKGPKLPFFCVQGNTALAHHLGPDQPFFALQPAPLEGKKSFSTVEDIAADFIKEIQTLQPEGPYLLGGFSFGSKVAFEMAHQLRKQGHEVRLVVLLDPGIIHNGKRSAAVSSISSTFSGKTMLFCAELHRRLCKLEVLDPWQKLTFLWKGMRWRVEGKMAIIENGIKKIACWVYLAMGLRLPPSLRSVYFVEVSRRAELQYIPYAYPGRLIVFPTEEMSTETQQEWKKLAGGGMEVHVVPGNHQTIMKESGVRLWAEQLMACLDEAQTAVYK